VLPSERLILLESLGFLVEGEEVVESHVVEAVSGGGGSFRFSETQDMSACTSLFVNWEVMVGPSPEMSDENPSPSVRGGSWSEGGGDD
jgi:hypothetical protein